MLDARGPHWRPLGKPPDQFIQKLFCADLEVKGVSAVLDADVEELNAVSGQRSPRQLTSVLMAGQHTANANNATFWLRELM